MNLAHGAGAMTVATLTGGNAERNLQALVCLVSEHESYGAVYCCIEIQPKICKQ